MIQMTRSITSLQAAAVVVVVCGLLLPNIGCGERLRRNRSTPKEKGVNTGLNELANDSTPVTIGEKPDEDPFDATRQQVIESANLLNEYFADAADQTEPAGADPVAIADPDPVVERIGEPTQSAITTTDDPDDGSAVRISLADAAADSPVESETDLEPVEAAEADPDPQSEPGTEVVVEQVEISPLTRKEQLVDELITVLTELAQSEDDPGASAIALAGLETIRPDTLDALFDQGLLSEAEQASLEAVGQLLRSMATDSGSGSTTIASPSEIAGMLERVQRDLNAQAGLKISNVQLCTRVSGYGQFEPFPTNTFVAGRAQRAIVYAEVERFAQRETTGTDGLPRFGVELTQRLELYHVADDLNIWNRAAETDNTTSRNRLRDYYLINQITLPANLSVGKYTLKVLMRDLVSDQVAEAIIAIEIVSG